MSVVNLLTRSSPTLGGIEFDAVLEDTFEAGVELTEYTIELGARASDHRIVKPFRWSLVVCISNNPLTPQLTDFTGLIPGASGIVSTVAGLSAGFLAGSDETRTSAALDALLALMVTGEPFDVDAVDIQLKNMVINNIRRVKDPSNENALIAEVELQEYATLETTLKKNGASQDELQEGDPAETQAAAEVDNGEALPETPNTSLQDRLVKLLEEKGEGDSGWAKSLRGDGGAG